jgi:hypothetical protein
VYQWCGFKSRRGKNYIYIYICYIFHRSYYRNDKIFCHRCILAQTIVFITGHLKRVYVLFIDERNIWHTLIRLKINQTVLELDFRCVKCLFFPRRDLNQYHMDLRLSEWCCSVSMVWVLSSLLDILNVCTCCLLTRETFDIHCYLCMISATCMYSYLTYYNDLANRCLFIVIAMNI